MYIEPEQPQDSETLFTSPKITILSISITPSGRIAFSYEIKMPTEEYPTFHVMELFGDTLAKNPQDFNVYIESNVIAMLRAEWRSLLHEAISDWLDKARPVLAGLICPKK